MELPSELRSKRGIEKWAKRYEYKEEDRDVQKIVQFALKRKTRNYPIGHLTRDELVEIVKWKSGHRTLHHVTSNREIDVIEDSHMAFVIDSHEPLTRLKGVSISTATAIMHFASPEMFPIFSIRALSALGIRASQINSKLWPIYQENCLDWSEIYGVSLRTLDRAMWQYDKEHSKVS